MTQCALPSAKVRKKIEFLTILRGDLMKILHEVSPYFLKSLSPTITRTILRTFSIILQFITSCEKMLGQSLNVSDRIHNYSSAPVTAHSHINKTSPHKSPSPSPSTSPTFSHASMSKLTEARTANGKSVTALDTTISTQNSPALNSQYDLMITQHVNVS